MHRKGGIIFFLSFPGGNYPPGGKHEKFAAQTSEDTHNVREQKNCCTPWIRNVLCVHTALYFWSNTSYQHKKSHLL